MAHSTVYSKAISLGYPYIRGNGKTAKDGKTWLSRFQQTPADDSPFLFVGWNGKQYIIEKE